MLSSVDIAIRLNQLKVVDPKELERLLKSKNHDGKSFIGVINAALKYYGHSWKLLAILDEEGNVERVDILSIDDETHIVTQIPKNWFK